MATQPQSTGPGEEAGVVEEDPEREAAQPLDGGGGGEGGGRTSKRLRRRLRRQRVNRQARLNKSRRLFYDYRVSAYGRNVTTTLAKIIRTDCEQRLHYSILYHVLRVVLYTFSFVVYIAAQINDEKTNDHVVFRMDAGAEAIWQDVAVFLGLADTVLRLIAHTHAPTLTLGDLINVFLTVMVILRFSADWFGGHLIVPNFLHIWVLREALLQATAAVLKRRRRSTDITQLTISMLNLILTLVCVVITSMCGVEHLEKGNDDSFSLFTSLWFVVVTFSTVGYGDYTPISVLGRVLVMGMILIAFIILPEKIGRITEIQRAIKEKGRSYRANRVLGNRHVVLIGGELDPTTVEDFLIEMRSSKMPFPVDVVVLSPVPATPGITRLLQRCTRQSVRFIMGSAMNASDLGRAAVECAEAIFIIAERTISPQETDRHAVLRAWAVNDYAPDRKLYVQITLLENVRHVSFAHRVMCFNELRFSLLGLSAQCPGISTLLTNMAHAVDHDESVVFSGPSDPLSAYQQAAQNQVFESELETSPVFAAYEGELFMDAAADLVEQKVCLLGVKRDNRVQLNPPATFHLRASDICIYVSRARDTELHVEGMTTVAAECEQSHNSSDDPSSPADSPASSIEQPAFDYDEPRTTRARPHASQPPAGSAASAPGRRAMARSRSADARSLRGSLRGDTSGGGGGGGGGGRGAAHAREPSGLATETGQVQGHKVLERSEAVAGDTSPLDDGTIARQQPDTTAPASARTLPVPQQQIQATQARGRSPPERKAQRTNNEGGTAAAEHTTSHAGRNCDTWATRHLRGPTLRAGNSADATTTATTQHQGPHRRVSVASSSPLRGRSAGSDHTSANPDDYVIVQVRLKEHAMFHGSPRHKCHFVEYWEQGVRRQRTLVGVSRPLEDLVLTWNHVNAESPIVFHGTANLRRRRSTGATREPGSMERDTSGSTARAMAHHRQARGGSLLTVHESRHVPGNSMVARLLRENGTVGGSTTQVATRDRSASPTATHKARHTYEQRAPVAQYQHGAATETAPTRAADGAAGRVPFIRTSTFDQCSAAADQGAFGGGSSDDAPAAVRSGSTDTTATASTGEAPKVMHSAQSHAAPGLSENERLEQRRRAFVVLALPNGEPAGSGVYHFIRVLRSATLSPDALLPIVVLVGEEWQLSQRLQKFMALFPLVYYHVGRLETPRSLLRACLRGAKVVLVLAPGVRDLNVENCMIDAPNIMATQNVHDVFPDITVLTELTHRPNVKFVRFVAAAPEELQQSLSVEEMQGSDDVPSPTLLSPTAMALNRTLANATLSAAATWRKRFQSHTASATEFLFRQSYASGQVFTTTMLDAVLYQSMRPEKESLLEVYRLLLGCEDDNNFLSLRPITEDLMRRRKLKDYGDLCRYFIMKKQTIVLGLKIERVMARSVHESHSKNLFARLKHAPRARLSRTMSGFVLQAILPNPDENFTIHPGDSAFLLQRRLDWRNIHKGVRGMNLTPRQKAVGLLTQYRPSVMAKRWLHKARDSKGGRDNVKATANGNDGVDEEEEDEQPERQQGSKLKEWATGTDASWRDEDEDEDVHFSDDEDDDDDRDDADEHWGRHGCVDKELDCERQRPSSTDPAHAHGSAEANVPPASMRQQQESQARLLQLDEPSTSTAHPSEPESTDADTYETVV